MPAIADVPRFAPTFTSWDLTGRDLAVPASVSLSVDGFSTHCIGGPKSARIRAVGHPNDLWEFMNWLRAPVDISYRGWPPVWWGFVSAVEININRARLRVSLDGMHNRIAIAHTIVTGTKSERSTTSWAEDALSIERYGYSDQLKSSSATSTTQTEAERNDQLAHA